MRLHLSVEDLDAKLRTLFEEEGLGVESLAWSFSDEKGPSLEVTLGAMPSGENRPLRVVVAELESRVRALEERPEAPTVSVDPGSPPSQAQKKPQKNNKQQRPPPSAQQSNYSTPRVAAMAKQIEAEQRIIGPKLEPGERNLSSNEYLEFPG